MDSNQSATSWGAIIAGAVAAAALTLVLVSLGGAVGFSSISPWPSAGVSAKTFQISTGLYFVFTALIASTVGGYLAGRLRTKWTGLHGYEVQFRDTAHGFLAWGLATLAGTAFLASAGALLAGGTAAGMSAGSSQPNNANADYYTAMLLAPTSSAATAPPAATPAPAASTARQTPRPGNAAQARAILAHSVLSSSDVPASDKTLLAQIVSAQTGASQADAEKRVDDTVAKAKADADAARKVAAKIAMWLTIAMFVGAFAASLAAIEGGQLRDRRWRGVIFTRAYNEARIEP